MNYAGKCLVARPGLENTLFRNSVVFLYEHNPGSVSGVILNKKSQYTTRDLFEHKQYSHIIKTEAVYQGGPVNTKAILLLHTNDWRSTNTMMLNKELSISSDNLMMEKFENLDIPLFYRFFGGAAVWHESQLKSEIKQNQWLITELSTAQIFDYTGGTQWDIAVESAAKTMIDQYF